MQKSISRLSKWSLATLTLLMTGSQLYAHPGHAGDAGFMSGLAHPVSGLDHLLAMVAVGLWAAQIGGRAVWAVPTAFVGVMGLGGLLVLGGFHLPFVEAGILASVVILGLVVATSAKWSLGASICLVGTFALFHGYAHAAEMPIGASGFAYALGFIAMTISLHLGGILVALMARRLSSAQLIRYAGAAVVLLGLWLASGIN